MGRPYSDIFSKDLESLLESSDELTHVSKQFVLVLESVVHFATKIIHESVSFGRGLLFKVLQEVACHVSALSEHIIKVA